MDILSSLTDLLDPAVLLVIVIGSLIGILIGAVPGLGVMIALVIVLPFTVFLEPLQAILLLLAVYQAAEYGGSISAIVLGIPGTSAAVPTTLDGHPLARQGFPGKSIAYSLTASLIGGLLGGTIMILLAQPLADFGLALSDPEYFWLGMLGLAGVALLSATDLVKAVISAILGLLAGMVGLDLLSGTERFTGGRLELLEGLGIVSIVVGLFAVPEILSIISRRGGSGQPQDSPRLRAKLSLAEYRGIGKATTIGSGVGSVAGLLPGLGPGTASWFSYAIAKGASKRRRLFGKGSPEGIAAPEAANNAAVGGALLPLLTLGIPGSPGTALIMGAFIIQGIQPGPGVFESDSGLISGILIGFLLTSIVMYVVGKGLTPVFASILKVPGQILVPVLVVIGLVGAYTERLYVTDIWIALMLGVAAFVLLRLQYSAPAFILAFVLSPIIETSFRRSLVMSQGDYSIFVTRPYSIVLLVVFVLLMVGGMLATVFVRRSRATESDPEKATTA